MNQITRLSPIRTAREASAAAAAGGFASSFDCVTISTREGGCTVAEPEHYGAEFGLVMPFVVCKSNGGPFDDHAFVAGARYGQIEEEAKTIDAGGEKSWYAEPGLVPQLDLLAMHHGLTMATVPWDEHPDEWTLVTFSRPAMCGFVGGNGAGDTERCLREAGHGGDHHGLGSGQ